MCTRWLQGLQLKTVQPVALAIPTTLSRLDFDEIRSRYISGGGGGSSTMGTSQTSVHTKRFVIYGIFRIELDSKQPHKKVNLKRLHVGSRIELSFGSLKVILYQTFLLLREEYDVNV
jgi:hypothetical protein